MLYDMIITVLRAMTCKNVNISNCKLQTFFPCNWAEELEALVLNCHSCSLSALSKNKNPLKNTQFSCSKNITATYQTC